METTVVREGYIGIMEKKMETKLQFKADWVLLLIKPAFLFDLEVEYRQTDQAVPFRWFQSEWSYLSC